MRKINFRLTTKDYLLNTMGEAVAAAVQANAHAVCDDAICGVYETAACVAEPGGVVVAAEQVPAELTGAQPALSPGRR